MTRAALLIERRPLVLAAEGAGQSTPRALCAYMIPHMPPTQLSQDMELDALLASDQLLLFKHSPTCPISAQAFFEYRRFCEAHADVPTLWLHVIEQRPASLSVAEATGVTHESPQALWIKEGEVAWHASHGAITLASLAAATGVG